MPNPKDFPRLAIGILAVALTVTLIPAILLRVGALKPKNLFPIEVINAAFTAHALGALILLPALLVGFVSLTRQLHGHKRRELPAEGRIRIVLGVASAAAMVLLWLGYGWVWHVLMAGSLVLVADAKSPERRRWSRLAFGFFAAGALALSLSKNDLVFFAGVVGKLVAAIVLVVSSWRAIRSSRAGAWPRRYYTLALVTFLQAVLMRTFLDMVSVDLHLHDTLFAVGTAHLEFFTPASALLGLLYRRSPRAFEPRAAMTGFVLLASGAHVFVWSMLRLGTLGMPRRYASYLPQFEPLQILCTCGAMLLMLGVVAAIIDLWGRQTRGLPPRAAQPPQNSALPRYEPPDDNGWP